MSEIETETNTEVVETQVEDVKEESESKRIKMEGKEVGLEQFVLILTSVMRLKETEEIKKELSVMYEKLLQMKQE